MQRKKEKNIFSKLFAKISIYVWTGPQGTGNGEFCLVCNCWVFFFIFKRVLVNINYSLKLVSECQIFLLLRQRLCDNETLAFCLQKK